MPEQARPLGSGGLPTPGGDSMTLADPPQVVNTAAIPHSSRSYVLLVNYTADLAAIDAEMPAHQRFLDQHVASGEFLVSGPRDPRTGGVILAHTISDARVAQIIATDPFLQQGLVTYEVIRFHPTRGALALSLRDAVEPSDATE
jgi:uncharacterized protein YciI